MASEIQAPFITGVATSAAPSPSPPPLPPTALSCSAEFAIRNAVTGRSPITVSALGGLRPHVGSTVKGRDEGVRCGGGYLRCCFCWRCPCCRYRFELVDVDDDGVAVVAITVAAGSRAALVRARAAVRTGVEKKEDDGLLPPGRRRDGSGGACWWSWWLEVLVKDGAVAAVESANPVPVGQHRKQKSVLFSSLFCLRYHGYSGFR